ncbi:MAG: hypothetical protein Q8Q38_02355 [bacterium]|nr:hypothetical protein [bacterium]MDZ4231955.1 hypothetical protein [Candidatus Pacearchaeota archaeon]
MKSPQFAFLESSLSLGRLSHAYLFSGTERELKDHATVQFLQLLLSDACGSCRTCLQIASFQHPDLALVEPLEGEGKMRITIDQVRELKYRLSLASYGGGHKVALLKRADLMASDAQSSLLKLLEEPLGQTVCILSVDHSDLLLDTIRSRTQEIQFRARKDRTADSLKHGSLRARFKQAKELGEGEKEAQEEALFALASEARSRLLAASLHGTPEEMRRAGILAVLGLKAEEAFVLGRGSLRLALEQAYMEL